MPYTHLSLAERNCIKKLNKIRVPMREIGRLLDRSHSTISREISRNSDKNAYCPNKAHKKACERIKTKNKAIKLIKRITDLIDILIREDWSPEQVAGRLKREGEISLHHESIYRYIYSDKLAGGTLHHHLRRPKKPSRWGYGQKSKDKKNKIPNRIDISDRPDIVNERKRVGDWEADTVIGSMQKGAILTVDERKSKLRLAALLPGKKSKPVQEALTALLAPIKQFVHTVTFDNGREFYWHENIAKALDCKTYFARPYHSWERGQNENANGLLRQYFPKKMDLLTVEQVEVIQAVNRLNNRPRKCLDYKTPYEVFEGLTGLDVRNLMGGALMS